VHHPSVDGGDGRRQVRLAASAVLGRRSRYHRRVAEQHEQPLSEQLEEIGSRLAWVRDYL
jgi:hypothetical protein